MRVRLVSLAVVTLTFTGCGGGDGVGAGRPGDDDGPRPSAAGPPRESGEAVAYAEAIEAFEREDFDQAIGAMASLAGYRDADARVTEFRVRAARATLATARRKLKSAPQAAVSQARTAQRYHPTSAGRRFLRLAQRELRRFQDRQADDVDGGADDGGRPPDAGPPQDGDGDGDGGPPPGAGPPSQR